MEPHVAEDEDLEKLKSWWKTNGTSILVGIALIVWRERNGCLLKRLPFPRNGTCDLA